MAKTNTEGSNTDVMRNHNLTKQKVVVDTLKHEELEFGLYEDGKLFDWNGR